jgi:tRNA (cmo5U34)-methyltransferase
MQSSKIKDIFDQQASGYDKQWSRLAPIRNGLHFLLESVFAHLPEEANILAVGAGTGVEIGHLAAVFPKWRFTALDPSGAMLAKCRSLAEIEGFIDRCDFHEGYVNELPDTEDYDGATCFLVSQFITDRADRADFFRSIAARLKPGATLASSDLSSDVRSAEYGELFRVWSSVMSAADLTPERREQMKKAYENDVAVVPPTEVADIIRSSGFQTPTLFYQAGLDPCLVFASRGLDFQHASESPRGVIRFGTVVIGPDLVVAAIAEHRSAELADLGRGRNPA